MLINLRYLKALQHLSAQKDVRNYLNGVYVEFRPDKTIYVATDGHVFGRLIDSGCAEKGIRSIIMPIAEIEKIRLRKSHADYAEIAFNDNGTVNFFYRTITPIDGKFPDYERIIPKETSGEVGNYDFTLLNKFAMVHKALGSRDFGCCKLDQNGAEGAARVTFRSHPEFTGVIMPFRS